MAVMNTRTAAPAAVPALPSNVPGSGGNGSGPGSGMPQIQSNNVGNPIPGGSGGMSPASAVSSPISHISNMGSPHQPGIGLKPGTQTPPNANVLQVVKQVSHQQEENPCVKNNVTRVLNAIFSLSFINY